MDFRRSEGRGGDEFKVGVSNELACEPEERSLEVVVGLGRDFKVLKVLLAVESDSSGLDFSLLCGEEEVMDQCRAGVIRKSSSAHLDINLVTTENNRNVLANTLEISVPVRNVLVGDL